MRLLYTSTFCFWDNSILVMLCLGDLMRIFYFIKNMFQFLPIALPLKPGVLQKGYCKYEGKC